MLGEVFLYLWVGKSVAKELLSGASLVIVLMFASMMGRSWKSKQQTCSGVSSRVTRGNVGQGVSSMGDVGQWLSSRANVGQADPPC